MILPKKIFDRKVKIKYENTLITGAKRVGKTFLVLNFLKNFKGRYFYIDFSDYKEKNFDFEKFDLIIFDNYDFSVPIPDSKVVFVISSDDTNIPGFRKIKLKALDFEEFFSFNNILNVNQCFDKFLRYGNFPRVFTEDYFNEEYLKDTFELLPYEKEILKFYFSHIGEKFTFYQIYQILKRELRISKDKFYAITEQLIKNNIVYEVSKFNFPKSPKKFYSYNFAFKNVLTNRKNIQFTFENIVFLELDCNNVFYKDNLTFYLPEEERGILVLPFANEESVKEKIKKINGIKKLDIITISNEFEIECKNFDVEVLPFIKWRFAE